MESQITYNEVLDLTAPTGGILTAIIVSIEIEPKDAGCLIYGYDADGNIQPVQVTGSHPKIELPFAHPKIYVRYLSGVKSFRLATLGWRDSARS